MNTKKGKDKKKSVPVSPVLYRGKFMLKSNVDTSIGVFAELISDVIFTNLHDNKQILGWQ